MFYKIKLIASSLKMMRTYESLEKDIDWCQSTKNVRLHCRFLIQTLHQCIMLTELHFVSGSWRQKDPTMHIYDHELGALDAVLLFSS